MITAKNFWLWFGGIWLSVGSLFLVIGVSVGVHQMRVNDRLEKEGRTVDGMVLTKEVHGKSSKSGKQSSPSYRVTFRFLPREGEPVLGTADVNAEDWDVLEERGPIPVTYLPDQPQSYRVIGQIKEVLLPFIFSVVGGVIGSIGGFIVFNAVGTRRREKELSHSGTLVEATVADIAPSYLRINGIQQMKMRYRFRDAQGKTREGSCTLSPEEAVAWLPGQTGRVRYNPRKPGVNVWLGKD
ncbi:MAG TPA: DUF3592 domain-containing protein [Nitrospiraceae bacterium]|nr:DUF3592 domain-containing protein [Nitrospiraceae bacterium]